MFESQHPLVAMADEIEKRGLVVIEGVTRMPVYEEPIVSPYFIIALNLRGWVHAEYDMQPVEFHPNDNVVIYPNHVLIAHESSDDYLATLVVLSARFFKRISTMHPSHYHFEYHYNTRFHLSDIQVEGIKSCFKMLKTLSELNHPDREELLAAQMEVTAHLAEIYFEENGKMISTKLTHDQQMMTKFFVSLAEHFIESREVKYYADLMHLSPKHFGFIVRKTTGIGASDWIGQYIVVQAKFLLRQQQQMTIQQIGLYLGFYDQANFSRYFKKFAGITPSEYRDNMTLHFVE